MDFRPIRAHAGSYLYFKNIYNAVRHHSGQNANIVDSRGAILHIYILQRNCEVSGHFGKEKQIPSFFLGYTLSGIT